MKRRLLFAVSFFVFASPLFSQVRLGIDQLEKDNFGVLAGRKVALITNQTGVDREGHSTVDVLLSAPNVKLVCVLTPEHGFRGTAEHGQSVSDWIDPQTHLPVYSLYGENTRPSAKMLKDVDTIVFDIQDIGTRFYTYITTMGMALEEAAKRRLKFVVLDRPNPLRGDIVEGDILDADIKRMTGYFQIPVRYGLTIGELAGWMNKTQKLHADLTVVPLTRWEREDWYEQTGLDFIPPSPNIKSINAAVLYPGIGCFEAANVSVGRGTETPFEIFGAPWIKGKALCAYLRDKNLPGVLFEPEVFTPEKDLYAGQRCEGVRLIVTDRNKLRAFHIFLYSFDYFSKNHAGAFKPEWEEVRVVTGSAKLRQAIEQNTPMETLIQTYEEGLRRYQQEIASFFLY